MDVDDQTDDNSGYKYTEYRKVKKGDDSYYDDILKTPEDNKKSLFTEELVKYFSFDHFLNHAFSGKIDIDCNNPDPDPDPDQDTLPEITVDLGKVVTTTDGNGNTIIDRPTLLTSILELNDSGDSGGRNLKVYYDYLNLYDESTTKYENKMEKLNPENEIHAGYMIGVARLVVEYFIYSSILYGIVYYNTTKYGSLGPCDKPLIKINYIGVNSDENVKKYIDYIVHAIFEVIEELNLKNYVFHSYVEDNVNYNKTFLKNNGLLKTKEKDFNNKKSTLITMMSKSKKMERQYSSHSFWNMIYLIVLITYILGLVGLSYFGMTLANEETKRLMAIVLICVASLVLTGMFSYKLVLYLFFNK
jgi:hypothetical protein